MCVSVCVSCVICRVWVCVCVFCSSSRVVCVFEACAMCILCCLQDVCVYVPCVICTVCVSCSIVCVCVRVCVLFHLLYVFLHRELNPGPNTESTKSWPVYYHATAHVLSFDKCLNSKTTSLLLSIPSSCKGPYYHTRKP